MVKVSYYKFFLKCRFTLFFKSPFKRQKYCKNIVILNSILTEVGDLLWQVLPSNVATWFFMVVFLDHATVIITTTTVLFVVAVGSCRRRHSYYAYDYCIQARKRPQKQ